MVYPGARADEKGGRAETPMCSPMDCADGALMTSMESGSLEDVAGPAPVARGRPDEAGKTLWRNRLGALLPILGAAAMCTVSVGVSVALIDRPVATWVHGQRRGACPGLSSGATASSS